MQRKKVFLIAAATLCVGLTATIAYLLRDPQPHVVARRSSIDQIVERDPTIIGKSQIHNARLLATSGLVVDVSVRRQLSDTIGRLPLVVLLGGHVTGARATEMVGDTPGVLVAAVSYPFEGDLRPSKLTFLKQIPQIRGAFLDTPAALMLALDYLLSRPDVDSTRVEGVGVSLGAPFITIAGALDPRFSRIWAIHSSGGSYGPLEASMRHSISNAPLRYLSAAVANVIINGPSLAPDQWVARIAPRPFIMVNAEDDERMPRENVELLYRSASLPKEQIWMTGGHIHADQHTIQRLVAIVLSRVNARTPRESGRSAPDRRASARPSAADPVAAGGSQPDTDPPPQAPRSMSAPR
jgi:hypothetical protein